MNIPPSTTSGIIGHVVFSQLKSMQQNRRALHGRDTIVNPPDSTTHYKSPEPKNIGWLERIGLKQIKVVTESIGGVDVELTYHSRTGGRSVVEVTGGPPELLGFTSTPVKGSTWAAEGRSQIEKHISKHNEPIPFMSVEQFHTVTEVANTALNPNIHIQVPK